LLDVEQWAELRREHFVGGVSIWPTDRRLRGVLRRLARRLAFLRAGRPAGQGRRRAPARLHGAFLRARTGVRHDLDYQLQLDCWFDERANSRRHKTLRERPVDRLVSEPPPTQSAGR
jgi:hypothetical protein